MHIPINAADPLMNTTQPSRCQIAVAIHYISTLRPEAADMLQKGFITSISNQSPQLFNIFCFFTLLWFIAWKYIEWVCILTEKQDSIYQIKFHNQLYIPVRNENS